MRRCLAGLLWGLVWAVASSGQPSTCRDLPQARKLADDWIEAWGEARVEGITPEEARGKALEVARGEAIACAVGIDVHSLDYRAIEEGGASFRDVFLSFSRQTSSGRVVDQRRPQWSECKIPIPGQSLPITVYQARIEVKVARQEGRPDPGFAVQVTPNKEKFTDGERMQLEITATRSCHVTVLNITAADTVVVILPHEYRPASYVEPGDTLRMPDEHEKAMGISYPVTVPEGRRQVTERILVIATKTEPSLQAGWRRTGLHNQVPTRRAALVHLMRWLIQVPREEWTEDDVVYRVRVEEF